MPKFSNRSVRALATCHPDLQRLFNEVIKTRDCAVLFGLRGKEEQDMLFAAGKSKLRYPHSKHNKQPSLAVDIVPLPLDWNNIAAFEDFAKFVKKTAIDLGIEVVHGGDWKGFKDYPHWELKEG